MTVTPAGPPLRRGLTLRRMLLLLVAAGVTYVAAIATVITLRISPTAQALQGHSTLVLAAHDSIRVRLAVLGQSIDGVHRLVVASSRNGLPHGDALRALVLPIRARLDSVAAMRYAESIDGVPTQMRMDLASAAQAEGDLGMVLLQSLAELQLGHGDSALMRLRSADEYRQRTEDLLHAAQRSALDDMVVRERALGDASVFASRAVHWWLLLGAGMIPLLALFLRNRVHRPLRRLEAALSRIAGGHLDTTFVSEHDDEIGRLGLHLNAMTAVLRLRSDDERRRRENLSERLGHLLEESSNQIFVFAADTLKILQASRGALEHLGYAISELTALTPHDVLPPADASVLARLMDDLRAGRQTQANIETRLRRKDGRSYPATVNVQLSYAESPPVFVVVAQDISERRAAERLRESLREFSLSRGPMLATADLDRILQEIAAVTARTLNAERASVWRLDGAQLRCAELFEHSRSRHSSGRTVPVTSCPEYVDALRRERVIAVDNANQDSAVARFASDEVARLGVGSTLDAPVRSGGVLSGVLRVTHVGRAREWTPEEQSFAASMADFVAIAFGGAEQRSLQSQLTESQRLESVGQLAGGVAHDFNNLLTAVLSHAELAGFELPEGHSAHADLAGIQHAAMRAADLTRQLLTFARRQVVEPRIVDLNVQTRKMDKLLRRLIGEDVELVTILDPALGATCIDPTQFEQVIVNLAVNARDAMAKGGKLTVRTSNVELDLEYTRQYPDALAGPYVMLEVGDTGCGMEEVVRARIFEPFFTTKDRSRGTGLGLATVYGIVRQARGHIRVTSAPGEGTMFYVYLPLAAEGATAAAEHAIQSTPRGSETILLVEDEPQIREVLARGLAAQGYRILVAGNGAEGLEVARQNAGPIHLLLTDVVMPLLNGRDLAAKLATERPETAVLFMSGYAEESIVHGGVVEKGRDFLCKPFTVAELAGRVRQALDDARGEPGHDTGRGGPPQAGGTRNRDGRRLALA